MTSPTDARALATASLPVADEQALHRLAARVAAVLGGHAFVALSGDLGAGKTTFVKAVAKAVGIDPSEVTSPTFGLIHVHALPVAAGRATRIVHADMYRLAHPGELAETGWHDAISGDAWVLVEWPERITTALPAERIDVAIEITSPTARLLTFTGRGGAAGIVRRLAAG
jgi:tRNA threonylcarbamoyl adenosine modification protein YjeE